MGSCSFKMPEDFLMKISKLHDKTDEIIGEVLKAGGEVVKEKVESNLQSVIGSGLQEESRSTGELVSALGVSSARQDKDGNFNVKVGFLEPRRDGKRNAMIAGVLEYGKHGQPPRPFLKPAKVSSKSGCIKAMINTLDEEVDKL